MIDLKIHQVTILCCKCSYETCEFDATATATQGKSLSPLSQQRLLCMLCTNTSYRPDLQLAPDCGNRNGANILDGAAYNAQSPLPSRGRGHQSRVDSKHGVLRSQWRVFASLQRQADLKYLRTSITWKRKQHTVDRKSPTLITTYLVMMANTIIAASLVLLVALLSLGSILYYMANTVGRAFLIVESFTALPNSPSSTYTIPNWAAYIPHI